MLAKRKMNKNELENRIKELELELSILKPEIFAARNLEEKLQECEAAHLNDQRLANMGSWVLNLSDQTAEWSENCFTIYGYEAFEFEPTFEHVRKSVHPDDWHIIEEGIDIVFKTKTNHVSEMRIILPDGTIKWLLNTIVPMIQDDKIVKLNGINIDITERKIAENKIIELNKKLLKLNSDKDRFISILGHDLKNPFNNILGLSEILARDITDLKTEDILKIAGNINKAAKITNKLLEDILLWARTQQGKMPFNPKILSFRDICMDIFEILDSTANAKNITINYSAPDEINVYGDIEMLKTVLLNLVSNAIKFTNNGGKINVNAEQSDSKTNISVSDNGTGIDPNSLAKLFDISEVLTTKGTAGESGTGLGLLLCKEFVEIHGGKIWAESEVGKGSDFKFKLPM